MKTKQDAAGSLRSDVKSCWVHTCATAYRRTLHTCPKCGSIDYDACGQELGEYQCVNPDCEAVHKIADLRPNTTAQRPAQYQQR